MSVACWIWALMQVRMALVYQGMINSAVTGSYRGSEPQPVLFSIAARSAVTFAIFGILIIVVPWPRTLTYLTGVWTCRAVLDAVLCWLGRGQYSVTVATLTAKGRRGFLLQESAKVVGNGVWLGLC